MSSLSELQRQVGTFSGDEQQRIEQMRNTLPEDVTFDLFDICRMVITRRAVNQGFYTEAAA